jgi:hypothetical protein
MRGRVLLRYVVPLATIAVLVVAVLAVAHADRSESAATAGAESLPSWAADLAQRMATANGDAKPAHVQFSLTTPDKIAAVTDEKSDDSSSQLYAIVMTGDFTMYTEHLPPGTKPPHADWIMLVLDPKTEAAAGMSASTGTVDTSAIGTMTTTSLATQ